MVASNNWRKHLVNTILPCHYENIMLLWKYFECFEESLWNCNAKKQPVGGKK